MAVAGRNGLNAPLVALRDQAVALRPLTGPVLAPGIALHIDPAAQIAVTWASPRARLLEVQTRVTTPGAWLGLHIALPPLDLRAVEWLGFAARSAAATALVARVALRSGLPEENGGGTAGGIGGGTRGGTGGGEAGGGFCDAFFDRYLLSQPTLGEHHDMLAPPRRPDLPPRAPWRELVLFLPPGHDIAWALHDLRLVRA